MCNRTRGRQKDKEQAQALKRRQAARRAIEDKQIEKELNL